MRFLAHRGLWHAPSEKNSPESLRLARAGGVGHETDLRDRSGGLVISHDPPVSAAPSFSELLQLYRTLGCTATLALNIKADGLRGPLAALLAGAAPVNYFCFDMSVPETLAYRREGLRFFSRESEFEPAPALYADAAGVWLDMFLSDWITPAVVARHLDAAKEVALVSPELHGRPHLLFWRTLRDACLHECPGLMLCTDFPEAARDFFHD